VTYLDAKRAGVLNSKIEIDGRAYTVVLQPGVSNLKAPCGGMFYNLEGGCCR